MSEHTFRDATHDDIPALLAMGRRFADAADLDALSGYDEASVKALFEYLIDDEQGVLIVMDGGAAGAIVHPALFNRSHTTASELFWWVDPDKRGNGIRLFLALEKATAAKGAGSMQMTTIVGLDDGALSQFYERRGYRATDRNFLKVFGG